MTNNTNNTNTHRVEFLNQVCVAARREGDLAYLIANGGEFGNIKKAIVDIKNASTEAKNAWLMWTNGKDEEFETVGKKHDETDNEYTRRIMLVQTRENLKYLAPIVARIYGAYVID